MKPRFPVSGFFAFVLLFLCAGVAEAGKYADLEKAAVNLTAIAPGQKGAAAVVLQIKPAYHVQSHKPNDPDFVKFEVLPEANPAVDFFEPVYPLGKDETYKAIGDKPLNVYQGRVVTYIPFQVKPNAPAGAIKISFRIRYQACDENSCFLPTTAPVTIDAMVGGPGVKSEPSNEDLFKDYHPSGGAAKPIEAATAPSAVPAASTGALPATAETGKPFLLESIYSTKDLESTLAHAARGDEPGKLTGADWSISYAFGVAFVVGLIFNIMPCVLPVLPLKAIGFYEVGQHKRSRSFMYGLVFSLGIIAVFAILAVPIVVLKKISWGQLFSEWWFIWPMVAVLVAMAFGLFGFFTFKLPVGAYSFEPRHDTFSGNFLLGGFTAILATPCTAPLLPPLLVWAASQPTYGVPAMLMVGVGMASPYLVLSALPELARKFPRTGPWSELFKQMMGFMLLAAAAFFAGGRLVESANYWWIVMAVVVVAGIFLVGRTVQLAPRPMPIGITSVLAILMVGGTFWWTARVTGLGKSEAATGSLGTFQPYSPELFDSLRKQNKIVLVKFTANWCATCQVIEGTVFHDPAAWNAIKENNVVALKADFSGDNPAGQALLNHLSTSGGIPLTAVYPPLEKSGGKVAVAE